MMYLMYFDVLSILYPRVLPPLHAVCLALSLSQSFWPGFNQDNVMIIGGCIVFKSVNARVFIVKILWPALFLYVLFSCVISVCLLLRQDFILHTILLEPGPRGHLHKMS